MARRFFRQEHPVLTGCFLLCLVSLVFWAGIAFLAASLTRPGKGELFSLKPGVGVVSINGVIVSAEQVLAQLTEFRDQDQVKAIVLRIDSPGGAVGASQEIYAEVQRTRAVKPVVASMGSVAASGGLYAAMGASKVVASPGTITGSIGVILKFANLEKLFNKIGYQSEVIKSGRLKDIGSASRPMTPEERQMLQAMIGSVHGQFIKAVAEGRGLSEERVRAFADGRIFSGQRAKELGLVDRLGNFNDAVLLAAKLGGLGDATMPELHYPKEESFSLFRLLAGQEGKALLNRTLTPTPVLAYEWTVTP